MKKTKTTNKVISITARSRYCLLPEGSLIWQGYAYNESGNMIGVDFVLLKEGIVHSMEDRNTGQLINYNSLAPYNLGRALFKKDIRRMIYDIYGSKKE